MAKGGSKPKVGKADPDLVVLQELIALLDGSAVTSIKLARGGKIYEVTRIGGVPHAMLSHGSHPVMSAPAPVPSLAQSGPPGPAAPAAPASNLIEIKSPMVGTFYRAPEPGAEPYVKVASRVSPGQTLCIIEAMKIMNEIESEVSGAVREILVEDAQPVEFGQVLFRVEPNV